MFPSRRARSLRSALASSVVWGAAVVAIGCRGTPPSDLFATSDAATDDDLGDDDAASPPAFGGDAAATSGDGGASASADGGAIGVDCQGTACAVGTQACCRRGATARYTYACEPSPPKGCKASGPDAPLALPCDDANDCVALGKPRTVCCGEYTLDEQNRPLVGSVSCIAPDQCLKPQARVVLCGDGDSSPCPAGTRCEVSQTALPGFRICVSDG